MAQETKFFDFLAVISVLGFAIIAAEAFSLFDLRPYNDSFLFVIIGFGLIMVGGIQSFIAYFKDGLTDDEVAKIITIVVGIVSIILGFIILPFESLQPLQIEALNGVRGIIALGAMLLILVQTVRLRR